MLKLEQEQEQLAIKDYATTLTANTTDMETLDLLEEPLFDEMRHAKWLKQILVRLNDGS